MHPRSLVHVAVLEGVCDGNAQIRAEKESSRIRLLFMLKYDLEVSRDLSESGIQGVIKAIFNIIRRVGSWRAHTHKYS